MSAGEKELTTLWRDIDALLAQARATRPLHRTDALLDLDRLRGGGDMPLLERLARAVDGWDGHLLLGATDNSLAPDVWVGDRLVIDPETDARDGNLVVAFTDGRLIIRRLRARDGHHWLESGESAPLRVGALVAIVGVVVELRRAMGR